VVALIDEIKPVEQIMKELLNETSMARIALTGH
jgi:hypothetical protein